MIVNTNQLFKHAYGKYAVGAYNINNLEQTMGLFRGNLKSQAPFIIQISKGARSYSDKVLLEGLIRSADEVYPDAIFAVHLDHGDEETAMDCIESGFYSSVMIDASHENFDTNIAITRRVVDDMVTDGAVPALCPWTQAPIKLHGRPFGLGPKSVVRSGKTVDEISHGLRRGLQPPFMPVIYFHVSP